MFEWFGNRTGGARYHAVLLGAIHSDEPAVFSEQSDGGEDADSLVDGTRSRPTRLRYASSRSPGLHFVVAHCTSERAMIVFLAVVSLVLLSQLYRSRRSSVSDYRDARNWVVGPRTMQPLYFGRGCDSLQFAQAVAQIKVAPHGAAKTLPSKFTFEPVDFSYSFDFPSSCPDPHVFTATEACDLLSAFGGIHLQGDSVVRMVVNALFIILTGRRDGATRDGSNLCWGDTMFDDRHLCRDEARFDSNDVNATIPCCKGTASVFHDYTYNCPIHPIHLKSYTSWLEKLSPRKQTLSRVIVQSFGLHCSMLPKIPLFGAIKPFLAFAETVFPRPLMVWMSLHAPGVNKPAEFLPSQGVEAVRAYNAEIASLLEEEHVGGAIGGGYGLLDWYSMSDGATSYDGSHYGYQINMEKAHLLLNYLDILWGEIAATGGIFDLNTLCPKGKWGEGKWGPHPEGCPEIVLLGERRER